MAGAALGVGAWAQNGALIVDDSKSRAAVFLARALEKVRTSTVDAADSAEAAIAYLSRQPPRDVIFNGSP